MLIFNLKINHRYDINNYYAYYSELNNELQLYKHIYIAHLNN